MNTTRGLCFCGLTEEYLAKRRWEARKWDKRVVRWAFLDTLPGITSQQLRTIYTNAFASWSNVCGLKFEQVALPTEADYVILSRPIDGVGGTLAESQLPYGNDAQIRAWMDSGDGWSVYNPPRNPTPAMPLTRSSRSTTKSSTNSP